MVFGVLWLGMVMIAGARPAHLVGSVARVVIALVPLGGFFAHDYQRERIDIWLDPNKDPLGTGFNILQAEISIGSGGLFGKGLHAGHADATRLPAHPDDGLCL